jgi:hypothetical protein
MAVAAPLVTIWPQTLIFSADLLDQFSVLFDTFLEKSNG